MPRIYVDADLIIWALRGNALARALFRTRNREADERLWVAAMQRAEVLFGMRPREEQATRGFLARFQFQPVTIEIVDLGASLYREWNPRAGTGKNDALLAATVLLTDGILITNNLKHFPMPDLRVEAGWDAP